MTAWISVPFAAVYGFNGRVHPKRSGLVKVDLGNRTSSLNHLDQEYVIETASSLVEKEVGQGNRCENYQIIADIREGQPHFLREV